MTRLKGVAALVIAVLAVAGFMWWIPALRYIFPAACVAGVLIAFALRAWHARKPVKDPEEDSVKLHLND